MAKFNFNEVAKDCLTSFIVIASITGLCVMALRDGKPLVDLSFVSESHAAENRIIEGGSGLVPKKEKFAMGVSWLAVNGAFSRPSL